MVFAKKCVGDSPSELHRRTVRVGARWYFQWWLGSLLLGLARPFIVSSLRIGSNLCFNWDDCLWNFPQDGHVSFSFHIYVRIIWETHDHTVRKFVFASIFVWSQRSRILRYPYTLKDSQVRASVDELWAKVVVWYGTIHTTITKWEGQRWENQRQLHAQQARLV